MVNLMNQNRRKKLKSIIIYFIIMLILLPLFIYSTYNIIFYIIESTKTKDLLTAITENTEIIEYISKDEIIIETQDNLATNLINVDLTELKKMNNETVAWIYLKGTNINYPIVQTNDNKFYLNHSFDKSYNNAGWLFMDYRNNSNNYDANTIIYAHNRKDKAMFGSLDELLTNEWYNNLDNRVIRMSSDYNNTLWQIFSVYVIKTTSDYLKTNFINESEYQNFLNLLKDRSYSNFNINVSSNDKILTLSTCHGNEKKLVVHAKLIKIEAKN